MGQEVCYDGPPFLVWEIRMPKIHEIFLNHVFYLYPSVATAESNEHIGASGFMVGIHSSDIDYHHVYAVTNSHVIRQGGATVMRINPGIDASEDTGNFKILETEPNNWFHHPDGDDIAVCPLDPSFGVWYIPASIFISEELVERMKIGPGDDVFMVGRFTGYDGRSKNLPTVRFGNISKMPYEPIYQPQRGISQESFLVEMRSVSGYSGSPVIVRITPFYRNLEDSVKKDYGDHLLGVDWGHVYAYEAIRDLDDKKHPDGWRVRSNSNMTAVVPAWKLRELLDIEELVIAREETEKQLMAEKSRPQTGVEMDFAEIEGEVLTKETFEDVLRKVTRPLKDDTKENKE